MNDVIEIFFLIFAIRVNIATLTSHSPKNRKNFEKRKTCLSIWWPVSANVKISYNTTTFSTTQHFFPQQLFAQQLSKLDDTTQRPLSDTVPLWPGSSYREPAVHFICLRWQLAEDLSRLVRGIALQRFSFRVGVRHSETAPYSKGLSPQKPD